MGFLIVEISGISNSGDDHAAFLIAEAVYVGFLRVDDHL